MSQSSDGAGTSPLQAELGGSSAGKWRYRAPGPLAVASNEGIDRTEPHLSFVHKMDLHPERVGSADDSFERLGSFERLSSVARNLAEKATTWATASMEFDVKLPGAGTSFLPGDGTGHATGQRNPHPNSSSPTLPRADEALDGRPGYVPEHTSPHDRKITRLQSVHPLLHEPASVSCSAATRDFLTCDFRLRVTGWFEHFGSASSGPSKGPADRLPS